MPSLKKTRKWARGDDVKGFPSHCHKNDSAGVDRAVDINQPMSPKDVSKSKYPPAKYKISVDGEDALLLFGQHRGYSLSKISEINPSYIDYLLKENFPKDLKDIALSQKMKLIRRRAALMKI